MKKYLAFKMNTMFTSYEYNLYVILEKEPKWFFLSLKVSFLFHCPLLLLHQLFFLTKTSIHAYTVLQH